MGCPVLADRFHQLFRCHVKAVNIQICHRFLTSFILFIINSGMTAGRKMHFLILLTGSRSLCAFQLRFIRTVNIQPRLIPGPRTRYQCQMVDYDIGLYRIIRLAVPFPRFLDQIQIVSEGEFFQAAGLHGIGIVNDDLRPDIVVILIPVA